MIIYLPVVWFEGLECLLQGLPVAVMIRFFMITMRIRCWCMMYLMLNWMCCMGLRQMNEAIDLMKVLVMSSLAMVTRHIIGALRTAVVQDQVGVLLVQALDLVLHLLVEGINFVGRNGGVSQGVGQGFCCRVLDMMGCSRRGRWGQIALARRQRVFGRREV